MSIDPLDLEHIYDELNAEIELEEYVTQLDQQSDVSPVHASARGSIGTHVTNEAERYSAADSDALRERDGFYDEDHSTSDDQGIEYSLDELATQEPDSPLARVGLTEWQKRCASQYNSFVGLRPALLQSCLIRHALPGRASSCAACGSSAIHVNCWDCRFPECTPYCGLCDAAAHPFACLHRRQSMVSTGFLPLRPLQGVDAAGNLCSRDVCFGIRPEFCSACGSEEFSLPEALPQEKLAYIMHGKVQFCKGHCKCTQCGVYQRQSLADFVKAGFWPGTPDGTRFETIIDQRVFQRFAALKDRSLHLSTKAWLEAFAEEAHEYGGQGESINASAFSASYSEWRYCQHDLRSSIQCVDELVCAACQPAPHSFHIDANMKLFVYGRGREPWRDPYYAGQLFLSSAEGVEHMETIDIALGTKEDDRCCRGLWAAAGDRKSRSDKMSISGTCFAVCRHQVPVAAVNLIRTGERYAYSHFLLTEKLLASNPPKFIHQDIACKLAPWRHKVAAAFEREELQLNATAAGQRIAATASAASRLVDVLPEAHGLLHSWACQVLFGALWKDGAAAGSGEDAELLFSFLSPAASTTRHMGESGRDDRLTDASTAWAVRKGRLQPKLLLQRMMKIIAKQVTARANLDKECMSLLGASPAMCTATILSLINQVKEMAAGELQKNRRATSRAMEFFTLSQRIADGEKLLPFVGSLREEAARTLAAKDGDLAQLHRLAASLVADLTALKSKREALQGAVISALGVNTNIPAEQLFNSSFNTVAEEYIVHHQNKLEALVVQRQKHWNKLQLFARTSKEKTKYKGKLREDESQLQQAVDVYNKLIPFGSTPRPNELTAQELMAQPPVFPWALEAARGADEQSLLHRHGTYASMRICEAFLKVQRLEEEMVLLRKEAQQYINYWEARSAHVSGVLTQVLDGDDLQQVFAPACRYGRYFSSDALAVGSPVVLEALRDGISTLLLRVRVEIADRLSHAHKVLGIMIADGGVAPDVSFEQVQSRGGSSDEDDGYSEVFEMSSEMSWGGDEA